MLLRLCVIQRVQETLACKLVIEAFLYTDGIVECRNPGGEDFGYGRLEAFLGEQANCHPGKAKKHLLETAARFTGAKTFEDDVTLLFAAFHPEKAS
jgi:serine phosphatase RsbU (regulator of sigma subunit)